MTEAGLLGRDGELRTLRELVGGLPAAGGAVVLAGGPGSGKTALLRAAVEHARAAGVRVLETSGAPGSAAFAGLRGLLRQVGPAVDGLPAPQRRTLDVAFGTREGPAPEPFMVALAVLNALTRHAAGRPILLAADELQWLDQESRDALTFLGRRVAADPIALICAGRDGGRDLPVLPVRPLGPAAARSLLTRHAADLDPAACERILREASGNPLALTELPVAWRAVPPPDGSWTRPPLTPRLAEAFAPGLAGLPRAARDVLLVAAADHAGDMAEILAATAALAGCAPPVDALDTAARARLLQVEGTRLRFRHPVVRSAVIAAEPRARLRAAHGALAEVLREEPHRSAWHRALAADAPDDALAAELAAAHPAVLRRSGATAALWAAERAAQLSSDPVTRARRLLDAARDAHGLGRTPLLRDLLRRAGAAELPAAERLRLEGLWDLSGRDPRPDVPGILRACATAGSAEADPGTALDLLLGAAVRAERTDAGTEARAAVVAAAGRLPDVRDPRHIAALALADPIRRGREVTGRLREAAVPGLSDPGALRLLGLAAHQIGDPARAVELFDRAAPALRIEGREGLLFEVLVMSALDLYVLGNWQRADEAAAEAGRVAAGNGWPAWAAPLTGVTALAHGLRGESGRVRELTERDPGGHRTPRGLAFAVAGRRAAAYRELRPLFDGTGGREALAAVLPFVTAAAGPDRDDAGMVLARLEEAAALTPAPLLHVQLPAARAVLATDTDAEELYRIALARDLGRWPLVKAGTELAYGRWLRDRRRVPEARTQWESARLTLGLLGAPVWADREPMDAPDRAPRGQGALSAREVEIAGLAADGLSNREIAERLFLSARTVGSHMSSVLGKLGIRSRLELAAHSTAWRDAP